MMKRLLVLMLTTTLAMAMAAQSRYGHSPSYHSPQNSNYRDYRNFYYGVRVGMSLSRIPSDEPRLDGGKFQLGINLGATAGVQVANSVPIYVEAGLLYTQKGGRGNVAYPGGEGTGRRKVTYGLEYLELPVVAKYFVQIGYESSFQPFVGGYVAYGVGGKVKDFGTEEEHASFSDGYFKRFDGGMRAGFALQFSMLYMEAAYDLGLASIGTNSFGSTKTGTITVDIGVNF